MVLAKNRVKDPSPFSGEVPYTILRRTAASRVSLPGPPRHSTVMPQLRVTSEGHNNKEFGP